MKIVRKILNFLAKAIAFIATWFVSFIIVAIFAPASDDGVLTTVGVLAVLVVPVVAACVSISPKVWTRLMSKIKAQSAPNASQPAPVDAQEDHVPPVAIPAGSQAHLDTPDPSLQQRLDEVPVSSAEGVGIGSADTVDDTEPYFPLCDEEVPQKVNIPLTKKKQTEMAEDILSNIETCVSLANEATQVSFFIEYYDEAVNGFATLMELKKVNFISPPDLDYYKFKDEFQWHLCDAIARAKDSTISKVKRKYKNSREFQIRAVNAFESDIDEVRNRFSESTAEFADAAIDEGRKSAGINNQQPAPSYQLGSIDEFAKYGGTEAILLSIDLMEGHEFEHWCAALLRKIGYTDVQVTRGSGDQGVDVLAQKDGIKYAIQCKCYSSDLGNTPVQEILAGKKFYHCHVGAVMTNRRFTKGANELAAETGILLWDREWISQAVISTYR